MIPKFSLHPMGTACKTNDKSTYHNYRVGAANEVRLCGRTVISTVRMTAGGILLSLSLTPRLWSQTPELPTPFPNTISDPYLIKAGTSVVSILSSSLENLQNELHFESIINRLKTIDLPEKQRSEVTQALMRFVQRNAKRNSDIGKTVFAICSALETIGTRGGDAGVDFLGDWLRTDKYVKTVRCRGPAKNTRETKELFFVCVARGLGFSGHPRGLRALTEAQHSPQKTLRPEYLKGVIRESIQTNSKIANRH